MFLLYQQLFGNYIENQLILQKLYKVSSLWTLWGIAL